jgi:RND superfamily putative drug exporter
VIHTKSIERSSASRLARWIDRHSRLIVLLTRTREDYEASGDNTAAVARGVAASAPAITSAALILVVVFAVFVVTSVPAIQQIGFANAVVIAIDAALVRLVLLPATMQLMGRWNWWLPGSLDRLLPKIGV